MQRIGPYVAPANNLPVLGIELAGIVKEKGSEVVKFEIGDKVFGYVNGGAYAEYCATDAKLLNHLPDGWSFEQGAATAEGFQVAHEVLFTECNLQKGQTVFAYAGASSLGIAIIQIAKAHDCKVIVTAGTDAKRDFCLSIGADHVINYKQQNVVEEIMKATNDEGVDVIIDPVGPSNLSQDVACLKPDSTILMNGTLGGDVAPFEFLPFVAKRATLRSYNTRGRSAEYQHQIVQRFRDHSLRLLIEGKMQMMPVDRCFALADVADAHRYMEADKNLGKIVLTTAK
jgi:NADPH:quinone reductase-like Zn-dependent oxidoreductase